MVPIVGKLKINTPFRRKRNQVRKNKRRAKTYVKGKILAEIDLADGRNFELFFELKIS